MKESNASFGKVISHIFPGFVLLIEIIIIVDIISPFQLINTALNLKWDSLLSLVTALVFLGTLLGVVIDAINHFLAQDVFHLFSSKYKQTKYSTKYIFRKEYQWIVYKELIIDELMSYYEAYFNYALALTPAFFIIPDILRRLGISSLFVIWMSEILLFIIMIILFIEAKETYLDYCRNHDTLMEEFDVKEKG